MYVWDCVGVCGCVCVCVCACVCVCVHSLLILFHAKKLTTGTAASIEVSSCFIYFHNGIRGCACRVAQTDKRDFSLVFLMALIEVSG